MTNLEIVLLLMLAAVGAVAWYYHVQIRALFYKERDQANAVIQAFLAHLKGQVADLKAKGAADVAAAKAGTVQNVEAARAATVAAVDNAAATVTSAVDKIA